MTCPVRALALYVICSALAAAGCDSGDAVARLDGAVVDGPADVDVADVRPDAIPDAAPDAAPDARPVDMGVELDRAVDAAPDLAVDVAVDAQLPEACLPWVDVPDAELVARLHAHLHGTYRPIEAELDLGGHPNRYTTARHLMFTAVEWFEEPERGRGGYECVYTGRFVASPPDAEPDDEVMNCEHTWPRARMSPRDSLRYSHEQSDIHHLLPTISGVNSLRGSERFGDVVDGRNLDYLPAVYGTNTNGEVVFQPRRERQGDIARVVFYFSVRWGKPIRDDEEAALRGWMVDDPVDRRERARNDLVEGIQGNRNPFVDCPQLVDRIADFAGFEPLDTEENLPAP